MYIARKDSHLYNKQKNTWMLGNTKFISCVKHDIPPYCRYTQKSYSTHEIHVNLVFPRPMYCITLSRYIFDHIAKLYLFLSLNPF